MKGNRCAALCLSVLFLMTLLAPAMPGVLRGAAEGSHFTHGTILVDFEDGIGCVADDYDFTASSSNEHVSTGNTSLELASDAEIGWGKARIYMSLGSKLGAAGAPSTRMTYFGFHIAGPKGNHNDVSDGNVLIQDIQLASDKGWFTYQAGSTYYLLADGASAWTTGKSMGSSTVIPGDFSGYVVLAVADFDVDTAADILSETQATHLSMHFNQAGGSYGAVYLDSFFYMTRLSFPYGTLLADFEDGIDCVADDYDFTASSSDEHASWGSHSLELASDTEIGWGKARLYMSLGDKLGAVGAPSAQMTYLGFHIAGPKGNHNDVSDGDVLIQDIQLASDKGWFSYQGGSNYYLLADGATAWTACESKNTSTVIPGDFSGYLVMEIRDFDVKAASELLSETGKTHISMHFNQAGGSYGSVYLDAFFYATQAYPADGGDDGDDEERVEDIDAPAYPVDLDAVAAINGTGAAVKKQVVYVLNDMENGQADVDFLFTDKTSANKFTKELSMLHTGDGTYSLKLSSPVALNWSNAVPYMRLPEGLGAAGTTSSRMTYLGFHIQTTLGTDFRIQDVQLSSEGEWYSLSGKAAVYTMADGADSWSKADMQATSLYLKSNWSGFVALPIAEFYKDSLTLVPADVFSSEKSTYLQLHFNQAGGAAKSIFLDTLFYSVADTFDTSAVQLVSEDGRYVAGKASPPANAVLTTNAASPNILDIDGYRLFVRETTVAGMKQLLKVPAGMTLRVYKDGDEATDTEAAAVGMVVKVYDGSTAKAAYVIADVRSMPVPARDFVLWQKINDDTSPLVIDGRNVATKNFTADTILSLYVTVPYGTTAAVYDDGRPVEGTTPVRQGMTIRCYDPAEPTLYNEYVLSDVEEEDITNGMTLPLAAGAAASVERDTVTVPTGTTVAQLLAMLHLEDGQLALVLDAQELRLDDEELLKSGMFLLLTNDLFEEQGRWRIAVESGSAATTTGSTAGSSASAAAPATTASAGQTGTDAAPTGSAAPWTPLVLLAASAAGVLCLRRQRKRIG